MLHGLRVSEKVVGAVFKVDSISILLLPEATLYTHLLILTNWIVLLSAGIEGVQKG